MRKALPLLLAFFLCLMPVRALMDDWMFYVVDSDETETREAYITTLIDGMTLEEKVYQLFIITPEALAGSGEMQKAGSATKAALLRQPVGGLIYFAGNLSTIPQTKEMIAAAQAYSKAATGIGLFIGVDEEGGAVARVARKLKTTAFPSMKTLGSRGDLSEAYGLGETIAKDIGSLGFNLNFAPVADVPLAGKGSEIGARAFGDDPYLVADMVEMVVRGLQDNGVSAALKHFPGLGASTGDTHKGASLVRRSVSEMEEWEFIPFRRGIAAGADFVMVGHITAEGIDSRPASLSAAVITGLLRDRLHYDGLVITDALRMKAISDHYTSAEAAVAVLQAGGDMLLMPAHFTSAAKGVLTAVAEGTLSEARIDESLRRIFRVKYKQGLI